MPAILTPQDFDALAVRCWSKGYGNRHASAEYEAWLSSLAPELLRGLFFFAAGREAPVPMAQVALPHRCVGVDLARLGSAVKCWLAVSRFDRIQMFSNDLSESGIVSFGPEGDSWAVSKTTYGVTRTIFGPTDLASVFDYLGRHHYYGPRHEES